MTTADTARTIRPIATAGMTIGIGMGGFFDGILFHQILQIHNMLSARVPTDTLLGAKVNMVWDGLFHAVVWIVTALGIALLWRAMARTDAVRSGRVLMGAILLGFGLFNLIEGIVDHHLLHVHHVYERLGVSAWDYLFLASGIALIATGWLMIRSVRHP